MKPKKLKLTPPAIPVTDAGCVDLVALAGDRYRLKHEHRPSLRTDDDPWLVIIPCECGHCYPHSATMIGYASNTPRGDRVKAVKALPDAEVLQDGTDGLNIAVPAGDWEQLFALVKPRRRRHLSPAQRAMLAEAGKAHRYTKTGPGLARPTAPSSESK